MIFKGDLIGLRDKNITEFYHKNWKFHRHFCPSLKKWTFINVYQTNDFHLCFKCVKCGMSYFSSSKIHAIDHLFVQAKNWKSCSLMSSWLFLLFISGSPITPTSTTNFYLYFLFVSNITSVGLRTFCVCVYQKGLQK